MTDTRSSHCSDSWLPLTDLSEGASARLRASDIAASDRDLLIGLGLAPDRRFSVCKTGSPWIIEVRGVRVGLSSAIAERLLVEPLDEPSADA